MAEPRRARVRFHSTCDRLWIGLSVISQAWGLYEKPENIQRFARAIEQGSHLDKALSAFSASAAEEAQNQTLQSSGADLKLSYFAAWVIAILLLMLIGRLAILAVKVGGELVLYDVQVTAFAKTLLREAAERDREDR